jgi:hypothetical protein
MISAARSSSYTNVLRNITRHSSRKMTFQSIPESSEWNAETSIFSPMIRAYAPTNTAIAAQLCQSFTILRRARRGVRRLDRRQAAERCARCPRGP